MGGLADFVRIGEGVQAEIFLRPDGSVLKLWRDSVPDEAVEREHTALRALAECPGIAPAVQAVVELDGRRGLVMDRVEGGGLAAALRTRPWSVGPAARALARSHARIHAIEAPANLPTLRDDLEQRIEVTTRVLPELAAFALEVLDTLPDGDRLCHGDFHVANVLGSFDRPTVIDWPNATRGDPDADVAHTNVLHRFGQPRAGTNRLERMAVSAGRRVFAVRYLSAYRSLRQVDQQRLERWQTVRAAARLAASVPGERQALVRYLEQRLAADRDDR